MGGKLFIMCRIKRWESKPNLDHDAMQTYNKMHAWFLMSLEWGHWWAEEKMEMPHEKV